MLTAVLRLVLALLHLSGFKLDHDRVPGAEGKRRLLGVIERARKIMPLTAVLRVLGLSVGRYHDWVGREEDCSLDDQRGCPRSKPQCLTYQEVEAIGDMVQAVKGMPAHDEVYMDSSVENLNKDVDKLLDGGTRDRVIAQIDVTSSSSLIEARRRSLKYGWSFLNHLDSLITLHRLIDFYVTEHSQTMPHNAFHGQTPDEMYFGRGEIVPAELAA